MQDENLIYVGIPRDKMCGSKKGLETKCTYTGTSGIEPKPIGAKQE